MNYKSIHIGKLIEQRVIESEIELVRICNFLHIEEKEVLAFYQSEDISVKDLLRWSKLLKYDFFRLYSQHIILYAPACSLRYLKNKDEQKTGLPEFRKNIYTEEVIEFILELISTGSKTKMQIIEEYRIPKTTLYKWISKKTGPDTGRSAVP